MGLLADHRVKPDIDVGFIADAVEVVFQIQNLHGRRQGEITDHLKDIGARDRVVVHIGGDVIDVDASAMQGLADLMDDPRTVDGGGNELVGDRRRDLPVKRRLGLPDVDVQARLLAQAVQVLDESLDIVGAAEVRMTMPNSPPRTQPRDRSMLMPRAVKNSAICLARPGRSGPWMKKQRKISSVNSVVFSVSICPAMAMPPPSILSVPSVQSVQSIRSASQPTTCSLQPTAP